MFENFTYDALLADVLASAPEGIDTRQGSIFYDAVSGPLLVIARQFTDLELVLELVMLDTTSGEYLDKKAGEYGVTRNSATVAKYSITFEGAMPDAGTRFFADGLYFVLKYSVDGQPYLEAEEAGTSHNDIVAGSSAVPVNNVSGLESATFGLVLEYGESEETDDSLRERVKEKIAGPAENGNRQHYKTWCESIEGVGIARIIPLWNGPNTVKAVLISPEGTGCGSSTVDAVQEYVDPATKGYTATVDGVTYVVGDGLGEGVANLGAHFTAASAMEVDINISADIELQEDAIIDDVQEKIKAAVTQYLRNLVTDTEDAEDVIVRVSAIGVAISTIGSIVDYQNLLINNGTANIAPGENYVPVLGEVQLNVL